MADDDFLDLAVRYLDGLLSQAEFQHLAERLAADPARRQAFVQLCLQAQTIREDLQATAEAPPAAPPQPSRRRWLGGGLAGAAAVLLAVSVGWWLARPEPVVARIIELDGTAEVGDGGEAVAAAVGRELCAGETLRTVGENSTVAVEYLDRTRLELGGETHVELSAATPAKVVRLVAGRLAADVTPQPDGQPLQLHTPQAAVIVRGTRFSTRTDGQRTRVAVDEGAVELQRPADAAPTMVHAGTVAVAAADAPITLTPLASIPVRPAGEVRIGWVWGAFAFDPVKNMLVTEDRGWVEEREPASLRVRASFDGGQPVLRDLGLGRNGVLAAIGGGQPLLWDRATGQLLRRFEAQRDGIINLALAPDGQRLAASYKRTKQIPDSLLVWSAGGELLHRLTPEGGSAQGVAFSPDSRLLACGTEHGAVAVWDAATGRLVRSLLLSGQQRAHVPAVAFSPDGRWLAAGGLDRTVRLWDTATWQPGLELAGLEQGVASIAFAPKQPWLAVGFADGWVRLFHRADGRELAQLHVTSRHVRVVGFSADGGTLAATGVMYRVKTWRIGEP